MNWIKCEDELPPSDGWYEFKCYNFIDGYDKPNRCIYDGWYFRFIESYKIITSIEYWRHCEHPIKRYGKIRNDYRNDNKEKDCNCPNRYLLNGTYMGKYCKCDDWNTKEECKRCEEKYCE